jgi:hypothetical protein
MSQKSQSPKTTRRKLVLSGAAVAATAALSAPAAVKAGPTNLRFQSTWPSKDIFHEYALDFAKKINDMTGGELRIEVLPAGAVVPVVCFAVYLIIGLGRTQQEAVERGIVETAAALAIGVDRELLTHITTLEAIAASELLDSGEPRAFLREARRVLDSRVRAEREALNEQIRLLEERLRALLHGGGDALHLLRALAGGQDAAAQRDRETQRHERDDGDHHDVGQVGAAQVGPAEIEIGEVHAREVGAAEVCPGQRRPDHGRPAQIGAAEIARARGAAGTYLVTRCGAGDRRRCGRAARSRRRP